MRAGGLSVLTTLRGLLAFHERVQAGDSDRRDAIAYWTSFVARSGLDALCSISDASVSVSVCRLFGFCCAFSKTNTELQGKLGAWCPANPASLLQVFEGCSALASKG